MAKIGQRGKLDDTMAAMFSNMLYREDYLFYAHIIGQCSVKIRRDLPAPAGVLFNIDHYELAINPDSSWVPFDEAVKDMKPENILEIKPEDVRIENDVKELRSSKGFDDFTLIQRLAILKHEMLHIIFDHVLNRKEDRIHLPWNYATDCALNQFIDSNHLPKECIMPKNLGEMINKTVPEKESSEFYYEMIKEYMDEQENGEDGEGQDGKGKPGKGKPGGLGKGQIDSHETWEESVGDGDLKKDITKKMLDQAQTETIKSKGKIPGECSDWLQMHSRKSEVNWKQVLRGIVGNKRVGTRSTIMRNDRRMPKRCDLRGKTKDRMFNLLVIGDVSGSMRDEAVLKTFAEVRHICDVTKTAVDLIQVDSRAYSPEKLSKSTKLIKRKGNGGTYLNPALELAKKHKIDFQAVVVLTDGGLFGDDITHFEKLRKKVIWLIEPQGDILPEMNSGLMKAFKLKA